MLKLKTNSVNVPITKKASNNYKKEIKKIVEKYIIKKDEWDPKNDSWLTTAMKKKYAKKHKHLIPNMHCQAIAIGIALEDCAREIVGLNPNYTLLYDIAGYNISQSTLDAYIKSNNTKTKKSSKKHTIYSNYDYQSLSDFTSQVNNDIDTKRTEQTKKKKQVKDLTYRLDDTIMSTIITNAKKEIAHLPLNSSNYTKTHIDLAFKNNSDNKIYFFELKSSAQTDATKSSKTFETCILKPCINYGNNCVVRLGIFAHIGDKYKGSMNTFMKPEMILDEEPLWDIISKGMGVSWSEFKTLVKDRLDSIL